MSEFMRGDESLGTLLNLVTFLDMERTSYLQWARANDDELAKERLRQERDSGQKPKSRKPTVETFEWSPAVELAAQHFELGQQLIHAVHTHQTKAAKRKPKITRYPAPRTATARAKRLLQKEAFQRMEQSLVFSDEPYTAESGLVRYSKHPPSAGWATPQNQQTTRPDRGKARPNQLRPRPGSGDNDR